MRNQGSPNNTKRKTVLFLALVLAGHFLVTLIYATPNHYFPGWVNKYAHSYMSPVFHQAWDLFAPDPPLKEKALEFRVKSSGEWTAWLDPGTALLETHDRWRLSTANIAYRMHQNAAFRVWEEVYRAKEVSQSRGGGYSENDYLMSSRGYRTGRYYAAQLYRKMQPGENPDSLQLRLIIRTPPEYPGNEGEWKVETINFPRDVAK